MNKFFNLFVAVSCSVQLAQAQPQGLQSPQQDFHKKPANVPLRKSPIQQQADQQGSPMLLPQVTKKNNPTAKSTALKSRLISVVDVENLNGYLPIDSSKISWTGERGADWNDIEDGLYDSWLTYYWDAGSQSYVNGYLFQQTIDSSDRIIGTLSQFWDGNAWENEYKSEIFLNANGSTDSVFEYRWDATAQNWYQSYRQYKTYNSAGLNDTVTSLYWSTNSYTWNSGYRSIYQFDNKGNQTMRISQSWDGSTWNNSNRDLYTYDAAGNVSEYRYEYYSNGTWNENAKELYTYNAAGYPTESIGYYWRNGAFEENSRSTTAYDANNNRTEIIYYSWANGQWEPQSRYASTYDNRGNHLTSVDQRYTNNNWENLNRYTYTYDGNDNRINALSEKWVNNQWENKQVVLETYNSYNQITRALWRIWEDGQWKDEDEYRYHYEEYGTPSPSSVANANFNSHLLKVYPVPAHAQLHVQLKWDRAQDFTGVIYDAQGRVYKKWSHHAVDAYDDIISLTGMPAGNYWIQISGDNGGRMIQQITVY